MNERNIEVRFNLLECVKTAIKHRLSKEEILSLLMTECDFNKTTGVEYILAVVDCKEYLNKIQQKVKMRRSDIE